MANGFGSSSTAASARTSGAASASTGPATIRVASAPVDGTFQQILVDVHGMPFYTYNLDTPTTSHVRGTLARLWPPLLSGSPSKQGATGKLSVISDINGPQVQYNGHFLYTFVNDTPGQVTGQGVQGFFIATPELAAASGGAAPSPAVGQSSSPGY